MKKERLRVSVLFLISLFTISINGQNSIDSLKHLLTNSRKVQRLETLNKLIDLYQYNNPDSAYYFAAILQAEANRSGNPKLEALGFRSMSISHFFKMKYFNAEQDILEAIKLQEQLNDSSGLANSYKILTGIYWETERYSKSINISFKALKLYEQTNDISGIVSSFNNIGLLYKKTGSPKESLEYYQKALKYIMKYKSNYNRGNLYNNIGITYKDLLKYDSALFYYSKALAEYKRENIVSGEATVFLNIGNIYAYHFVNKDSAMLYYSNALRLAEKADYTIETDIYSGLGKLFADKKEFSKSIDVYKKIIEIAESNQDMDIQKDAHYDLYKVFNAGGDKQNALKHIIKYIHLKDTLNIEKAKITIANLETKFENEKKQLLIEKLKDKQETDRKMRILLYIGMLLLFMLLILIISEFIQNRKKSRLKRELLNAEKEQLEKDVQFKSRQLTSQAIMMMHKNRLLGEILTSMGELKAIPDESKQAITRIKQQLKRSIRSEQDWKLFKHYFEEINPDFYPKLLEINSKITPSELKLSALIKLNFNIKETAALLNISPDSVKTTRHVLRTKLRLEKGENIYDYLNRL